MANYEIRWPACSTRNSVSGGATLSCGVNIRDGHYLNKDEIILGAVQSRGEENGKIVVPKSHVPELIEALQRMIAGPLGRLALEAERSEKTDDS